MRAPTMVPLCADVSDHSGIFVATTPSTIMIAIHSGMTQTGSHPMSRRGIACNMKLAQMKKMTIRASGQPIVAIICSIRPGFGMHDGPDHRHENEDHNDA